MERFHPFLRFTKAYFLVGESSCMAWGNNLAYQLKLPALVTLQHQLNHGRHRTRGQNDLNMAMLIKAFKS